MRIYGKFLIILIAFSSISAWGDVKSKQEISSEAKSKAPHISSQELAGYQSAKEDFVLLDIRGKLEYYIQEVIKDSNSRIVLYCRTGGRSALATLTLKDMGYTNVVDLEGGFKEWVAGGNTFYNLHGEHRVVRYQQKE